MSDGYFPKRVVFGNLEGAIWRRRGGKEKEWTDCVQSDIARRRERQRDWETCTRKSRECREAATQFGLVDESKISSVAPTHACR